MPALSGDPLPGSELAAFAAAVESASIHGAGDALDLTQSAVTKRIQSLERRIGGELLERGRFGVRPTELGRAVYPPARRALQQLDEVRRAAERSGAERAPHLALAAGATVGEALLPGCCPSSGRLRPTSGRHSRSPTRRARSRRCASGGRRSGSSRVSIP